VGIAQVSVMQLHCRTPSISNEYRHSFTYATSCYKWRVRGHN